ncbi:unnamed protein product [Symbiodinium microadriaticum]|nr:unnamed protein product [Symbiodinium microadriaticum]
MVPTLCKDLAHGLLTCCIFLNSPKLPMVAYSLMISCYIFQTLPKATIQKGLRGVPAEMETATISSTICWIVLILAGKEWLILPCYMETVQEWVEATYHRRWVISVI